LPPSAALTATTSASYGDHTGSLVSGGPTRTYILHVPATYDRHNPTPLLLALHGRYGDGKSMGALTHLNQLSDQHEFIVVYPDGY
jgi:polyhydroxybutyrate depolymerase